MEKMSMKKGKKNIRFLVATDIHLGHQENHSVRKHDSLNAFKQVFDIAERQMVDFVLLGGDLFDELNPSPECIYQCLETLRGHVFEGPEISKEHQIDAYIEGDPEFIPNFKKSHLNVNMPVFTIHGNHDYPHTDFGRLSICDLLHVTHYANYFGKHSSLKEILIKPLMIEKPGLKTKVAIYGLGYIKDSVLHELFKHERVKFQEPKDLENTFCLFIFHQNRYKKGYKAGAPIMKCISAQYIPEWIDLTIWGHQHEAIPKIQYDFDRKIFQPGSTIITSFIEAQSYVKQSLIVEVGDQFEQKFTIRPIPLKQSYRPMHCELITYDMLTKEANRNPQFEIYGFLEEKIVNILKQYEHEYPGKLPIVRIKVEYKESNEISRRFQIQSTFSSKVANPQKILFFEKKTKPRKPETIPKDSQLLSNLKLKQSLGGEDSTSKYEIIEIFLKNSGSGRNCLYPVERKQDLLKTLTDKPHDCKGEITKFFDEAISKKENSEIQKIKDFKDKLEAKRVKTKSYYNTIIEVCQNLKFQRGLEDENQLLGMTMLNSQALQEIMKEKEKQIQMMTFEKEVSESAAINERQASDALKIQDSQHLSYLLDLIEEQSPSRQNLNSHSNRGSENVSSKARTSEGNLRKKGKMSQGQSDTQSEEEDCCKRAERQKVDEVANKMNFMNVHKIVDGKKSKNNKKKQTSKAPNKKVNLKK